MALTLKVLMWLVIAVVPGGALLLPLALKGKAKGQGASAVGVHGPVAVAVGRG